MNHKLLNRIKKVILNNPDAFMMEHWFTSIYSCQTAACVAGWACVLSGLKQISTNWVETPMGVMSADDAAQRMLGLTSNQCDRLFFATRWPESLRQRYYSGDKTAAVEMIELIQREDAQ